MPVTAADLRPYSDVEQEIFSNVERLNELRARPAGERTANWATDVRQTRDMVVALDAEVMAMQAIGRIDVRGAGGPGPAAATGDQGREFRTPGQVFAENEEVRAWVRNTQGSGVSPGIEVERRALIDIGTSSYGGELLPAGSPYLSPASVRRRRLFVRDLVAPGQTTLSSVPYVRELTPATYELGATAVAESAPKPEATIRFDPDDAPVRVIAAWVPITRQALEDVPTMRSYVDGRLGYMVLLAEEDGMINGPGTGATIKGILAFSGVQSQAYTSTDKAITVGLAVGKIEAVDGEADGIAINPVDFWTLVTARQSSRFDGEAFDTNGAPFGGPPTTLWGLPAVRTRTIASGQALVGAFRMGAQVFDRETVTIRATDSHGELFVKNQLVILAEARLAFAVHAPHLFCKALFA